MSTVNTTAASYIVYHPLGYPYSTVQCHKTALEAVRELTQVGRSRRPNILRELAALTVGCSAWVQAGGPAVDILGGDIAVQVKRVQ